MWQWSDSNYQSRMPKWENLWQFGTGCLDASNSVTNVNSNSAHMGKLQHNSRSGCSFWFQRWQGFLSSLMQFFCPFLSPSIPWHHGLQIHLSMVLITLFVSSVYPLCAYLFNSCIMLCCLFKHWCEPNPYSCASLKHLQTKQFLDTLQGYLTNVQCILVQLHQSANPHAEPFVNHAGTLRDSRTGCPINGRISPEAMADAYEDLDMMCQYRFVFAISVHQFLKLRLLHA